MLRRYTRKRDIKIRLDVLFKSRLKLPRLPIKKYDTNHRHLLIIHWQIYLKSIYFVLTEM